MHDVRIVGQTLKKGKRVMRPERHSNCVDLNLSKAVLFLLPYVTLNLYCDTKKQVSEEEASLFFDD